VERLERARGVALILALLVLSFLTVLGAALLTTSTIDIWINDNYKHATQSLYLAEAGIDHAREALRTSGHTLTDLLTSAAGPDHLLQTADDVPLIPSRQLAERSGFYEVWLRNDNADGAASPVDSNEVVTLLSIGQIGTSRKTMEVTVQHGGFPENIGDRRLTTVAGLEDLARRISTNAADAGRIVAANGGFDLATNGEGLLLVRGDLNVVSDVTWNGLVLVIGQGVVRAKAGAMLTIYGGLFTARTRSSDGALLSTPSDVAYTITDAVRIKAANAEFPYNAIATREK
jgi:Tfp pilus assembly protein PilX